MNDISLIRSINAGDEKAFTLLYRKYKDKTVNYFRGRYMKDKEYSVDLYQDCCTILWEKLSSGRIYEKDGVIMVIGRDQSHQKMNCTLGTYIISIGHYMMMARLRKSSRFVSDVGMEKVDYSVPDASILAEEIELKNMVYESVGMLEAACLDILTLFYWVGASGKEIAQKLNYKNADSVKTQKLKCMRKLEVIFKNKYNSFGYGY